MNMVKRFDIEPLIRQAWLDRPTDRRTEHHVLAFYGELSKSRPELLAFRSSGDKYQTLKSVLRDLIDK